MILFRWLRYTSSGHISYCKLKGDSEHSEENSCCVGGLSKAQSSSGRVLGSHTKQNTDQISSEKRRQWSSSPEPEAMEKDVTISQHLVTTNPCAPTTNDETMPSEQTANHMPFINQAALTWHEMRREWIGDQSKRPHRTPREPTISWCATYEDLLSTNQPFSQPIPLSEMVDFLVDVWQEEGLYD